MRSRWQMWSTRGYQIKFHEKNLLNKITRIGNRMKDVEEEEQLYRACGAHFILWENYIASVFCINIVQWNHKHTHTYMLSHSILIFHFKEWNNKTIPPILPLTSAFSVAGWWQNKRALTHTHTPVWSVNITLFQFDCDRWQ